MAKVYWKMSAPLYHRYVRTLQQAHDAATEGNSMAFEEAMDQLKSLPGYPSHDPDNDTVVPWIDDPYLDALIAAGDNPAAKPN